MTGRIRTPFLALIAAGAAALLLAWSAARVARAQETLAAAEIAQADLRQQAREVLALRSQRARLELRERPKQDVIAQVMASLVEAGLPANAMRELAREGDVAVADAGSNRLRKQSIRVSFEPTELASFGAFLAVFRRAQPAWVPSRVDLVHAKGGGRADLYVPRLLLTSLYMSDVPAAPK